MPHTEDLQNQRDILKSRAAALAMQAQPDSSPETGETIETVGFVMAGEAYGLELVFIREILPLKQLTPLPGVPDFISGVINLRGEIISIMDLRVLFDLDPGSWAPARYVLILSSPDMAFGIAAEGITGIQKIPENALQPRLPTISGLRKKYLKGLSDSGMAILDGGKLLANEDLVVCQSPDTI